MYKVFSGLSILISLLFSIEGVFALEVPFTDIKPSDPYYESIGELYAGRVITDNGDHLFRPKDLMNRDFFVSLAVGIGCHQCETPRAEDIVKYQISPFIDLPKINRYYYCTAYAKDINVIQGYVADTTGQSTCEDGKKYMSSPFCSENTISRIEATAILLRQAKIWDDTRNSGNFEKNLSIPDTTAYWYGYAKKGIETKIITQKSNGEIGQNDKITRGEFAMMAARILRYTQCDTKGKEYTIPSAINILDGSGTIIEKSHFSSGEIFSIVPSTQSGTWDYRWSATNITTGQTISGSGRAISNTTLSNSGNWLIVMNTIDPNTKKVVSQATTTLNINGGQDTGTGSCLLLRSNPLIGITGSSFRFTANVCGNNANQNYSWDYGDGNTSTITGSTTHNYTASGIYTVTLTVTDTITNRTGQSSVTIQVTGGKDTDSDGILDIKDECPLVYAKTPTGCPQIQIYKDTQPKISISSFNGIETKIGILDNNQTNTNKTTFDIGEVFYLIPKVGTGTWQYNWIATNITNINSVIYGTGNTFSGSRLGIGYFQVQLNVIEPGTQRIIASPNIGIIIKDRDSQADTSTPCVTIEAIPLQGNKGIPINLNSHTCNINNDPLEYSWEFGDQTISNASSSTSHTYSTGGIYTIRLTITNKATQKSGYATVIVRIGDSNIASNGDYNNNICLIRHNKEQGLLIGKPNCIQCPCSNTISIDSPLRSCDIVFPTILSPTLDTVYSRGGFYLIP